MKRLTDDINLAGVKRHRKEVFEALTLVALAMTNPALSHDDRRRQAYLSISKAASKAASKQQ